MIAHITTEIARQATSGAAMTFTLSALGFVLGLVILDQMVRPDPASWRKRRRWSAVAAVLVAALVLTPGSADSASEDLPVGLPDLISDPSYIWFDKLIETDDGDVRKVLAFDGYIHNLGPGMLDMFGNPQIPGDVRQRFWNGEDWEYVEGDSPLVLFETTDGHEHFHLMAASAYELWDFPKANKVSDSSKVGFCLVDTEQRAKLYDAYYDIGAYDYCQQYKPDADVLRMGISPGWVDLYDANTTLQWVDISETRPGEYWVGAITDPDNQVVEADETNNGLVFSQNSFAATGYVARPLPVQVAGEPIVLEADLFGQVGPARYMITQGPEHGELSVPVGVDFASSEVVYAPEPGFVGVDSFAFTVRDGDSYFPLAPAEVTVEVDAAGFEGSAGSGGDVDRDGPESSGGEQAVTLGATSITSDMFLAIEPIAASITGDSDDVRWYGAGLPPGVSIDVATGLISGTPREPGAGQATVTAVLSTGSQSVELPWTINHTKLPELGSTNDFASRANTKIRLYIGAGAEGARYSATGLPEGTQVADTLPLLAGNPDEVGEFEVTVEERVDGQLTRSVSFTWTVLGAAVPRFPL